MDRPPAALRFRYGAYGKPRLAEPSRWQFSVSSTDDQCLIAVSQTLVGIDVESSRPLPDVEALARRIFTGEDASAIEALPAGERSRAFLERWTCHEAFRKALGGGLTDAEVAYAVRWLPRVGPRVWSAADHQGAPDWSLVPLPLDPVLVVSLAVRANSADIAEGPSQLIVNGISAAATALA